MAKEKTTKKADSFVDAAIAEAAKTADHTKRVEGGGEGRLIPEGQNYGRLIEYIELGTQKRKPYKGKPKDPSPQVLISFELLGKKSLRTTEDGKVVGDRVTKVLNYSLHKKAPFAKLFDAMKGDRTDVVHMAQLIDEPFAIKVIHSSVGDGADKKTYANITDEDGNFLVGQPYVDVTDEDGQPTGERKKVKVADRISERKVFLFDRPNQATWDSLFIDGEVEKEVDGKKVTKSKNWIQEKILDAINFHGSALEEMLKGSAEIEDDFDEEEDSEEDTEDDEDSEDETEDDEAEDVEDTDDTEDESEDDADEEVEVAPKKSAKAAKAAPAKKTTTVAKTSAKTASHSKAKTKPAKASASDDALAALGLV